MSEKKRASWDQYFSGLRRQTPHKRLATVWVLGRDAGNQEAGDAPRILRPSAQEVRVAIETIRQLAEHARRTGGPAVTEELQQLDRWLTWIVAPVGVGV